MNFDDVVPEICINWRQWTFGVSWDEDGGVYIHLGPVGICWFSPL